MNEKPTAAERDLFLKNISDKPCSSVSRDVVTPLLKHLHYSIHGKPKHDAVATHLACHFDDALADTTERSVFVTKGLDGGIAQSLLKRKCACRASMAIFFVYSPDHFRPQTISTTYRIPIAVVDPKRLSMLVWKHLPDLFTAITKPIERIKQASTPLLDNIVLMRALNNASLRKTALSDETLA